MQVFLGAYRLAYLLAARKGEDSEPTRLEPSVNTLAASGVSHSSPLRHEPPPGPFRPVVVLLRVHASEADTVRYGSHRGCVKPIIPGYASFKVLGASSPEPIIQDSRISFIG